MDGSFILEDILPPARDVLQNQGFKPDSEIRDRITALFNDAMELFMKSANPQGIIAEISIKEFAVIYEGESKNDIDNPLIRIFPQADYLALFALTMGEEVSTNIETLFQKNDFPVVYMLDTIASLAADNAAELYQGKYMKSLTEENYDTVENYVLAYSPGYCGWHISGQKKMFEYLKPEKIGITLNDSFLMKPLKSVSGVLIAGKKKIHIFPINFYFCQYCKTKSCRQRIKNLTIA